MTKLILLIINHLFSGTNIGTGRSKHMIMTTEDKLKLIWAGCLNNERKSQELLYKMFAAKMLAVCIRYTNNDKDEAQDILQEGFIKIFRNAANYRGDGSLEGWIRRIMVHAAISRYRKLKPMVLMEDMGNNVLWLDTGYRNVSLEAGDLLKMIQQLSPTYRNVFNMYAIEGYSHQEISEALGISELSSRTNLHRARAILKEKLYKLEAKEMNTMAG
jgi:RNA polymerase sigma-70 factor (ECF subfamily)